MNARAAGECYPDRAAAGRALAAALAALRTVRPLILGLPRGGVPVAAALRGVIGGDLDILLVRKLGAPGQPELAMGAIAEGGIRVINDDVVAAIGATPRQLAQTETQEQAELARRARRLRAGRKPIPLRDRVVVVVDDGVATGATALVACQAARAAHPRQLIFATPVAAAQALGRLRACADEVVSPLVRTQFSGVGAWYQDFHQLDDAEVWEALRS